MLPTELCEGAASLLADQDRPAVLWTIDIDDSGATTAVDVRRARVRSRQALDYETVQRTIDDGTAAPPVSMLRTVGDALLADADRRNAFSLPRPQQEVHLDNGGRPQLHFRSPLPAERWNEQISLLTGRAAATLMLEAKVGLLRTLPVPEAGDVESLRRSAVALGFAWPPGEPYGDVLSRIDPLDPRGAALLDLAPRLLRGAGYTPFDGAAPDQPMHSAVGAPYAHCTAPLRRLADRFVSETCLAVCSGAAVPDWVRASLPQLPELMARADHRAHALDRAATDLAEAIVLQPRVGESFAVTVVEADAHGGMVQLDDPAVRARCIGKDLPLGEQVTAQLTTADPSSRRVQFTYRRTS
jgi:exoribonuclease R